MSHMMRTIGIDGNEANVSQRVGSNVYAYELLRAMEQYWRRDNTVEVIVFVSQTPLADMPAPRTGWRYEVIPHAPVWNVWKFPWALQGWRGKLDILFSPGHYLPLWSPVPTACTIMDLGYEHYPQFFKAKDLYQLKIFTRLAVQQSKHVFAISQATARDVQEQHGVSSDQVSVAYPGISKAKPLSKAACDQLLQELSVEAPYVLFVGTLQPRKNIERLVAAFEQVKTNGYQGKLILAGKIGWQADPILAAIENSPVHKDIVHLGFVTAPQKTALMQQADVLVLPGLYEGFGLPPLEAAQLGTLPVVANTGALPEVVPDQELQFDPLSVEAMSNALTQVLAMPPAQKERHLAGLQKHAQAFAWSRTAEHVCQTLVSLL